MADASYDWLAGTYWYVPHETLLAIAAVNGSTPAVEQLVDQTVWRIERSFRGYVAGIAAVNFGGGWSYMLIAGSVAPGGAVRFGFSPLDSTGSDALPTMGDGTLRGEGKTASFLMQMTSGSAARNVSHWSYMLNVAPGDTQWSSLPGYPQTGIPDLGGLRTPIVVK